MTIARVLWLSRPGCAVLQREPVREPGPGEARVRSICSGVAAGLSRLIARGELPEAARSALPPFSLRGTWPGPLAFGSSLVGAIDAVGPGVSGEHLGERVLLAAPHQDTLLAAVGLLRTPPSEPPAARVTLASALESAIAALWDAEIVLGERVVVIGLGTLGQLVAWLARRAGALSVTGVDPDAPRAALAVSLGATDAASSVIAAASEIAAADVVVEACGSAEVLGALLAQVGPGARLVVPAFHAAGAALPLEGAFVARRAGLRSSRAASLDPRRRTRARAMVAELLHEAVLDRLIGPPVPFSEAPAFFAELAQGGARCPPHTVIAYQ